MLNLHQRLSETACLDFDLSCAALGRWAEGRANETKEVPAPRKPKHVIHVPVYETVAEMLGLDEDDAVMDEVATNALDEAARDLLTGKVDWRTFGVE